MSERYTSVIVAAVHAMGQMLVMDMRRDRHPTVVEGTLASPREAHADVEKKQTNVAGVAAGVWRCIHI